MNKLKYKSSLVLTFLSLMLVSSCVSNNKFLSAQQDVERLKNDSLQLIEASRLATEEAEKLIEQNEMYKERLREAEQKIKEQDGAILAATQVAVKNEMKLKEIADELDVFETKFSQVSIEDGHVKLVMDQAILFEQGSDKVNNQGDILIERLAATLKKTSDIEIAVEGHTDSVPVVGEDSNWDLSVDRSIAVIELLTNKYGVRPSKLIAAGKSKYDPVAPNESQSNMSKNRRVEFIIMPDLKGLETEIEE